MLLTGPSFYPTDTSVLVLKIGPALSGNLAASAGEEIQLQTILLILCKHGRGDHLILGGGEVVMVWQLIACEQDEEQDSRVIIYIFPQLLFFFPREIKSKKVLYDT